MFTQNVHVLACIINSLQKNSRFLFEGNVVKVNRMWETGVTGGTDFIIVRCSVTNTGLPSRSQFRLQGNVEKVSRIWESMFNVTTSIFFKYKNISWLWSLICARCSCPAVVRPLTVTLDATSWNPNCLGGGSSGPKLYIWFPFQILQTLLLFAGL